MTTRAKLAVFYLLTSLPAFYTMSLDTNVTAGHAVSSSLEPSVGGLEMRKLRHMEAELEVLRRTVTELKAGGQCGSQRSVCNTKGDILKEVMSEIQGLRSQFQALQMRRELSALRSDIFLANSLLADSGSRRDDLPEGDARKPGSDLVGRTAEAGNERPGVAQNSPSILSTGSVYERWGHAGCPNDTEMVYSGVIGGSNHDQPGAAANALCLPLDPVLENNPGTPHLTSIVGAELEVTRHGACCQRLPTRVDAGVLWVHYGRTPHAPGSDTVHLHRQGAADAHGVRQERERQSVLLRCCCLR